MRYRLCLEGVSTADRSKGIITEWYWSQLGTPSFPECLSSLQISIRIPEPGFSHHLQTFEMEWADVLAWRAAAEKGIYPSKARRNEHLPCSRAATLVTQRRRCWCSSRRAEGWKRRFYCKMALHSFHQWPQKCYQTNIHAWGLLDTWHCLLDRILRISVPILVI